MGFFDFLISPDINAGVAEFSNTPKAALLDVRTQEEYAEGRVPHSKNIPLHEISRAEKGFPDHNTPLFVYCLSGARSRQAVSMLQHMGYHNVKNIGGISGYRGAMEG